VGRIAEPRLLYWRIFLVGWGTVVGTGFSMAVVMAIWTGKPIFLAIVGFYSIALGAVISVIVAIPMLVIWVPVFAIILRKDMSVRRAAILTTTVVAAVGNLMLAIALGIWTSDMHTAITLILPWTPVAMGIAACLAWYAFKSEEVLGTK
jgi:hypothetical protein